MHPTTSAPRRNKILVAGCWILISLSVHNTYIVYEPTAFLVRCGQNTSQAKFESSSHAALNKLLIFLNFHTCTSSPKLPSLQAKCYFSADRLACNGNKLVPDTYTWGLSPDIDQTHLIGFNQHHGSMASLLYVAWRIFPKHPTSISLYCDPGSKLNWSGRMKMSFHSLDHLPSDMSRKPQAFINGR